MIDIYCIKKWNLSDLDINISIRHVLEVTHTFTNSWLLLRLLYYISNTLTNYLKWTSVQYPHLFSGMLYLVENCVKFCHPCCLKFIHCPWWKMENKYPAFIQTICELFYVLLLKPQMHIMIYWMVLASYKGKLAPRCRALDAVIKKFYHGIQKDVHPFRFKLWTPPPWVWVEPQF